MAKLPGRMNCVVTGGAGFIGSHVVDALVARGDRVTVIDNLSTGKRSNLEQALRGGADAARGRRSGCRGSRGDLRDGRPELVFHLAAQIDVRHSVERIRPTTRGSNVLGTIAVLEAARAAGARRVVNTSTGGGLYGDADVLPTPEDHPIRPLAPYGQGKYAAEGYCELYTRLHGLSTVSLRYGNVYGPRQDVHGEAGVVAIFCGCPDRRAAADRVRRRAPDARLGRRQRRGAREPARRRRPSHRAGQHRPRAGDLGARPDRCAQRRSGPRAVVEPEFAPERPGEVSRSCLDVTRAAASSAGGRGRVGRGSVADPGDPRYRFSATRGASRVKNHQPTPNVAKINKIANMSGPARHRGRSGGRPPVIAPANAAG